MLTIRFGRCAQAESIQKSRFGNTFPKEFKELQTPRQIFTFISSEIRSVCFGLKRQIRIMASSTVFMYARRSCVSNGTPKTASTHFTANHINASDKHSCAGSGLFQPIDPITIRSDSSSKIDKSSVFLSFQ